MYVSTRQYHWIGLNLRCHSHNIMQEDDELNNLVSQLRLSPAETKVSKLYVSDAVSHWHSVLLLCLVAAKRCFCLLRSCFELQAIMTHYRLKSACQN